MHYYFHPESDCHFYTQHPLGMDSGVETCVEITEAEYDAAMTKKGTDMSITTEVIEGVATRVTDEHQVAEEAFEVRKAIGDEQAAAALPPEATITDDKLVKIYVKIREAKSAFVKAHEAELKEKYETPLAMISTEMKRRLQGRGNSGLKTEYGTAYIAETLKVSVMDGAAFHTFLRSREDGGYDFLENRVKAGEVKTYIDKNGGVPPPGLNIFREYEARIRKPTKRGAEAVGEEPSAQ